MQNLTSRYIQPAKRSGSGILRKMVFCLFFPGLFSFGALKGHETHDIAGCVYDTASGESLPYANVVLLGSDLGAVTNSNGYFVIVNAPLGSCRLLVSYIGYLAKEISVENPTDSSKPLRIGLEMKAINLGQVEVVADNYKIWEKAENTSQITLAPHHLDVLPNFGEVDIFRSLQLLPGISGISDGSSGLYVRGGTPDQNMVILDGMTVYHVDHFFGMFSAFNADAIKDVQVYKGGFPAKYGGRLSGVVDLTGKNGDQNERRLSAGVNLLSANLLYEMPLSKNVSWLVSARRSYTDMIQSSLYNKIFSFVTDDNGSTPNMPGGGFGAGRGAFNAEVVPSFYFYDLNSKLSFTPTERDFFSLSFYSGKDNLDKSRELSGMGMRFGDSEDVGTRIDQNLTDWGNLGSSLKWSRQWHDRLYTNLLMAYSNYTSNHTRQMSFNSGNTVAIMDSNRVVGLGSFATDEYNDVRDFTLRLDAEWNISQNHKIGFGTYIGNISTGYTASFRDTLNIMDIQSNSTQSSVYLQDEWKALKNLALTFGLRSTYHDQTAAVYNAPRFAFSWSISNLLKLKGAWGHYYQFINNITNEQVLEGSHDFWLSANEHLKPGFSTHKILGLSYETTGYLLEIEAYYKTLDNLVEFSRRFRDDSDYLNYFFFGNGISEGIEFLAQKKMGKFNGWISYTLANVGYTFPRFNNGESFPASHDRTHELKLVGSYQRGPWNFSATWIYGSGQPYTAPESQYYLTLLDGSTSSYIHVGDKNAYRLPDYQRMDISVSRRFETAYYNWNVGVSVFNLYDHANVYYRDYDLETTPIVVTDVLMLGFTPTFFLKLSLK